MLEADNCLTKATDITSSLPSITIQAIPTFNRSLTILMASLPPSKRIVTIGKPSPCNEIYVITYNTDMSNRKTWQKWFATQDHFEYNLTSGLRTMSSNRVIKSVLLPKNLYLDPSSTMIKCVWSPFRGVLPSPAWVSTLALYLKHTFVFRHNLL